MAGWKGCPETCAGEWTPPSANRCREGRPPHRLHSRAKRAHGDTEAGAAGGSCTVKSHTSGR